MANGAVMKMPKRFDYAAGSAFNAEFSAALEKSGVITLDCSDLEHVDSAGIGLLVMSQKKAQARQAKILLVNLKSSPRDILQLANLQKIIEMD